ADAFSRGVRLNVPRRRDTDAVSLVGRHTRAVHPWAKTCANYSIEPRRVIRVGQPAALLDVQINDRVLWKAFLLGRRCRGLRVEIARRGAAPWVLYALGLPRVKQN